MSGNGLRIFARHLFERGIVNILPFSVTTAGGVVTCQVHEAAVPSPSRWVSFHSSDIPVTGHPREVLEKEPGIAGIHVDLRE
jgi:diaminopimelate epimerase